LNYAFLLAASFAMLSALICIGLKFDFSADGDARQAAK
jgi:hypothetical protein